MQAGLSARCPWDTHDRLISDSHLQEGRPLLWQFALPRKNRYSRADQGRRSCLHSNPQDFGCVRGHYDGKDRLLAVFQYAAHFFMTRLPIE